MGYCHIGDTGTEMLIKHYLNKDISGHELQKLILDSNDLTATGVRHVVKILMKS